MRCILSLCVMHAIQSQASAASFPSLGKALFLGFVNNPSTSPESINCEDGVCKLPTEGQRTDDNVTGEPSLEDDLVAMGFLREDARDALEENDFDMTRAAISLEAKEEVREEREKIIQSLMEEGWRVAPARSAVDECNGNMTAALELLEIEEASITNQFSQAVNEMVENGWEEIVSRQALLAQWDIDQRKSQGQNVTVSQANLDRIRPTLRIKQTKEQQQTAEQGVTGTTKDQKTQGKNPAQPAKKEDCVFDVDAKNFQEIVLESPVPVLIDIYADWCGPCKQLGPILENAAMQSGGMFRLAKVNSDNQRQISEKMKVQGLPTVYALSNGKLLDRFVGMLPQDSLQQFLVRAITGYGERVQNEMSESEFEQMTSQLWIMAGLANMTTKKKARIEQLVDDALDKQNTEDGSRTHTLSNGVKTSLLYISNAAKDILNPKFRSILTTSKGFGVISDDVGAMELLKVAGFRVNPEDGENYSLIHNNTAVLNIIKTRVNDAVTKWKYSPKTSKAANSKTDKSNSNPPSKEDRIQSKASTKTASTSSKAKITEIKKMKSTGLIRKSKSPRSKKRRNGKANTLFSTGITAAKEKKNNEYFGGDSTVFLAAADEEEGEE